MVGIIFIFFKKFVRWIKLSPNPSNYIRGKEWNHWMNGKWKWQCLWNRLWSKNLLLCLLTGKGTIFSSHPRCSKKTQNYLKTATTKTSGYLIHRNMANNKIQRIFFFFFVSCSGAWKDSFIPPDKFTCGKIGQEIRLSSTVRKGWRLLFLKGNCLSPHIIFTSCQRKTGLVSSPTTLIIYDASRVTGFYRHFIKSLVPWTY